MHFDILSVLGCYSFLLFLIIGQRGALKDLQDSRYSLSYLHYGAEIQFCLSNLDQPHFHLNTVIPFLACWLMVISSPKWPRRVMGSLSHFSGSEVGSLVRSCAVCNTGIVHKIFCKSIYDGFGRRITCRRDNLITRISNYSNKDKVSFP